MTSLAQQLARRQQELVGQSGTFKVTPSVLYTIKDAGAYDLEHVYVLAVEGFRKLEAQEASLSQLDKIISPSYKGISRGMLTSQENEEINSLMQDTLLAISEHFLRHDCSFVLEYLLRNFKIHEYQPDLIFTYFLQFHASSLFTRLLQNFVDNHRAQNDMLAFLYDPISRGDIISRELVIQQIGSDYRILKLYIEYAYNRINLDIQGTQNKPTQMVIEVVSDQKKQRSKPDTLSFLYSLLHDVQSRIKQIQYVEHLRGFLTKLCQTLLESSKDEHLSFIYLLLTSQIRGIRHQWLNNNQIGQIGSTILKNFETLRNVGVIWDMITLISSIVPEPRTITTIFNLITLDDIRQSTKLQSNHILLQQILQIQLGKKSSNPKEVEKITQWLKHLFVSSHSKIFLDQLVESIVEPANSTLAQSIHQQFRSYLVESNAYRSYFKIEQQPTRQQKLVASKVDLTAEFFYKQFTRATHPQQHFLHNFTKQDIIRQIIDKLQGRDQENKSDVQLLEHLIDLTYTSIVTRKQNQQELQFQLLLFAIIDASVTINAKEYQPIVSHFIVTLFFLAHFMPVELQRVYVDLISKVLKPDANGYLKTTFNQIDADFEWSLVRSLIIKADRQKTTLLTTKNGFQQFIAANHDRVNGLIAMAEILLNNYNILQNQHLVQRRVCEFCLIVLEKSSNHNSLLQFIDLLDKENQMNKAFGIQTCDLYYGCLALLPQNEQEQRIESLQRVFEEIQNPKELGKQLNKILTHVSFTEREPSFKSFVIGLISDCDQEFQTVYIGNFDVLDLLKQFRRAIEIAKPILSIAYLNSTFKENINSLQEDDIYSLLQTEVQNNHILKELIDLSLTYVLHNKSYKLPIHKLVHQHLLRYFKIQGNDFQLTNPECHNITSLLISTLCILMKFQAKKQIYGLLINLVESTIKQKQTPINTLLLIRIIVGSMNKHVEKYFHNHRFQYLLSSAVVLLQAHIQSENSEPTALLYQYLDGFTLFELWLPIHLVSRFEFQQNYTQFLITYIKQQWIHEPFQILSALGKSIFYSQAKENSVRASKGLPIIVQIKPKQQKEYASVQLNKIIQKSHYAVKSIAIGSPLRQYTLKRQIFNILTVFGTALDDCKVKETNSNDLTNIISCIKQLSKIQKWYKSSKVGELALKHKTTIINLLTLDFLLATINNSFQDTSIQKLLLYGLNQHLEHPKMRILNTTLVSTYIELLANSEIENTKRQIQQQQIKSLQLIVKNKKFLAALLADKETSNLLFDKLLALTGQQDTPTETKIRILDIVSIAIISDRYIFIPYAHQILQVAAQLYLYSGKDQTLEFGLGQLREQSAHYLEFDLKNKDFFVGDFIQLSTIVNRLIEGFSGTISKADIITLILVFTSQDDKECQEKLLSIIEIRIVLSLVPKLVESAQRISYASVDNLAKFLSLCFIKIEKELASQSIVEIVNSLISLLTYPKTTFIDAEIDHSIFLVDSMENNVISALISFASKLSDVQLKKTFNMLIQWAKQKPNVCGYQFKEFQKLTFFKLAGRLSNDLGPSFTKYFAYMFDSIIHFFEEFHEVFSSKPKRALLEKRQHDESDMYYKLYILECRHALQCVIELCANDKNEFLDTEKFERLSSPLALVIDCARVLELESLEGFIEEWVQPAVVSVFELVNDDFKWKTFHYQILQVLQKHTQRNAPSSVEICISICKLITKLIDILDDRYTVLVNDLVPYIHSLSTTQTQSAPVTSMIIQKLKTIITQMIIKINKITGEEIGDLLKPTKMK